MTNSILFIYSKNGNLKALKFDEAIHDDHEKLLENGWKHTNTIDSATFLQDLLKDSNPSKILKKIKMLHLGCDNDKN